MKAKLFFLGFLLIFLVQCDNSSGNCDTLVCSAPVLSVELLDANGTNLITNGTYPIEEIKVYKGEDFVYENFNDTEESIIISIYQMGGENTYQISLNSSETDILILNLVKNTSGGGCCSPKFEIESATYNGNSVEVIMDSGIEKIVVVK